jgi:hypothetical protein
MRMKRPAMAAGQRERPGQVTLPRLLFVDYLNRLSAVCGAWFAMDKA